MTEPENFDDELFADLYNDDEPASKSAVKQEADQFSAIQASAPEVQHEEVEDIGQQHIYNGGDGDVKYEEDAEEDDDDDIDFNLGNGPSTTMAMHHDHHDHHDHDEKPTYSAPPTLAAPAKGPNAKEDG
ncbi:hypothetical protein N0V88_002439 [Collariella sp. IMI 366227]|nr:hypothetical protein N0V88_002439 [Collariella sp. IMI 366227]